MIESEVASGGGRTKAVLRGIGVAPSTWYRRTEAAPKRPGPPPKPLDEALKATVVSFATRYPWWGYNRLTIVLRRAGHAVGKKFVHAVFKAEGLLQKRRATKAELYQRSEERRVGKE